jgi:outer membrane scaffolding protein for murein synthesis (MipA/OmpV family)
MPDGSFDSYIGAGVITRPVYEGADKNKRNIFPAFQIELSNGLYVAGMSAGWHLSETPVLEYGPLLQIEPGRTPQGVGNSIDTPAYQTSSVMGPDLKLVARQLNRLDGMTDIKTRLLAGGFTHFRINDNFRITNSLLYGAGNNKNGLRLTSDVNYRFSELPRHHSVAIGLGLNVVNQAYAESYFGVSEIEAGRSINEEFHPKSGIKDFHLDINWNYSLSSAWIITSKLRATQLVGSVKDSPLVEKKNGVSVSTALAYRF